MILGSTIDCKRIKLGEVNQRKTYVSVYTDSKGIRELGEELLNTGATKHFLYRVDGDADALLTICLEILRSSDQFMGAVRNHLDKMKPVARGAGDLCFGVRGGCENLNAYMDGVLQQYDSKDGAANADINAERARARARASDLKVGGVQANKSSKRDVSTSAVIAELAKDKEHMVLFQEYVRFEQMITGFARTMHNLQYDAAMGNGRIS